MSCLHCLEGCSWYVGTEGLRRRKLLELGRQRRSDSHDGQRGAFQVLPHLFNLGNHWHLASACDLEISEINILITPKHETGEIRVEQVEVRVGLRTRSALLWGHA